MWHEEPEEMMEYLKSVFRVDIDYRLVLKYLLKTRFLDDISNDVLTIMDSLNFNQCYSYLCYSKRRLAQKYFGVNDPDYYEWETHIFFDDAFKKGPADAPGDKPVRYHYKYYYSNLRQKHCKIGSWFTDLFKFVFNFR